MNGFPIIVIMQAQALVHRLLVFGPILFIGAISVRARLHYNDFEFTTSTIKQHEAILAYQQPCQQAFPFMNASWKSIDKRRLRSVADRWIEEAAAGKLQPLTQVHALDLTRDGVKRSIFRTNAQMVHLLIEIGRSSILKGRALDGAGDLLRAIRLAEVVKYSDAYSVQQLATYQRVALYALQFSFADLDTGQLLKVRSELRRIDQGQQSLEPILRLTSRLHRQAYGGDEQPGSALAQVATFLEGPDPDRQCLSMLVSLPRAYNEADSERAELVGLLRMAGLAQSNWTSQLRALLDAMRGISVVENPEHARVVAAAP